MKQKTQKSRKKRRSSTVYLSGRLRILMVVGGVLVLVAAVGGYLVTLGVVTELEETQQQQLIAGIDGVMQGVLDFEQHHLETLNLVRATNGVPQLIISNNGRTMQSLIEPLAANAGLNSVVLTDRHGVEVLGLQQIAAPPGSDAVLDARAIGGPLDYAASTGTDLSALPMVSAFIWEDVTPADRPVGLAQTPQGFALYTAGPVVLEGNLVGVAMVGSTLAEVTDAIRSNALSEVVVYLPNGDAIGGSLGDAAPPANTDAIQRATLHGEVFTETAWAGGRAYLAGYAPLALRGQVLGAVGVFVPNNLFTATAAARQLLSLVFASGAAAVLGGVMVGVTAIYTRRLGYVQAAVEAIGEGDLHARTGMYADDEVGALGASVDAMAAHLHQRMETLSLALREQRRESTRLTAVLESMPDGVVVQDHDGRVILMNEQARRLFGSRRVFRDSSLNVLTAVVTNKLGPVLAPGVYALGTPVRVAINQKIVEAQAAAVTVTAHKRDRDKEKRIGTVIILRDVSTEARAALQREALLGKMTRHVQHAANVTHYTASLSMLMAALGENMLSLKHMIKELRDLNTLDRQVIQPAVRPLSVTALIRDLAQDWQDAAGRAGLSLQMAEPAQDIFITGDERRLRWALGNLLDNAIKYTPRGGTVRLAARQSAGGKAAFSVNDDGVGIDADELPFIWQRFFRGTPRLTDGSVLRRAGNGQGLFITRKVIEAHGGSVELESQPGVGTEVWAALPLAQPEPVDNWPAAQVLEAAQTR